MSKTCANALYTTTPPDHDRRFILLELKDKGGLTYPSNDVLKVAEITERVIIGVTCQQQMANQ